MNVNSLLKQNWNVPIGRARQIQMELAGKIAYKGPVDSIEKVKIVAGVDVSYDKNNQTFVSLVICSFPDMKEIERICFAKIFSNLMPYIPQYLSFREIPPVLSAFKKLKTMPDVILVDGQGIAHPRRIGLATHLGILVNIPTIGCAKSHLYGTYEDPPPGLYGAYTFLKDESAEIIGIVLRTRMFVKPLFISTGHMINLEVAGDIVMGCLKKRRIPEPLRLAHIYTQRKGDTPLRGMSPTIKKGDTPLRGMSPTIKKGDTPLRGMSPTIKKGDTPLRGMSPTIGRKK